MKLSTGDESTWESYLELSTLVFGTESAAVKWIKEKIEKEGPKMEVLADESQMVNSLYSIHVNGVK